MEKKKKPKVGIKNPDAFAFIQAIAIAQEERNKRQRETKSARL